MGIRKLSNDEIKKIELEILSIIVKFCHDNNIKYSLGYGTLLGAIRHRGFIPWDDDIDIIMPRQDYDVFCDLISKNPLSPQLELVYNKNKKSFYPFAKIVNKNTIAYKDKGNEKIWVDIFPMDLIDDHKVIKKANFNRKLMIAKLPYKSPVRNIKNVIKKIIRILLYFIPQSYYANKIEKMILRNININSKYYSNVIWNAYDVKDKFATSIFDSFEEVQFEDLKVKVIADWDIYLKKLYGNYMELPPLEKRRSHNLDAWIIDEGEK